MSKVHVIGHKGMIGSALMKRDRFASLICDITSIESIRRAVEHVQPSTIILCAAKTDVDWCEKYPLLAGNVNCGGVSNLLNVFNGRLIYLSTDYIFSGKKFFGSGYSESHDPIPVNWYGRTKWSGETLAMMKDPKPKIIRTSKLFDKNYVINKFKEQGDKGLYEFSNVLKRSYLHIDHFIDGLEFVLDNWEKIPTILNISGTDVMSEYLFMSAVAAKFKIPVNSIIPRNTKLRDVTPRPIRGGLNVRLARTLGVPLYSAWEGIELL